MAGLNSDTLLFMNFNFKEDIDLTGNTNRNWTMSSAPPGVINVSDIETNTSSDITFNHGKKVLQFTATNPTYMYSTVSLDFSTDFSIDFVAKVKSTGSDSPYFFFLTNDISNIGSIAANNANLMSFYLNSNGYAYFKKMGSTTATNVKSTDYRNNNWQHYALVFTKGSETQYSKVDIYIDGTKIKTVSTNVLQTGNLYLCFNHWQYQWNGYLSYFRIQKGKISESTTVSVPTEKYTLDEIVYNYTGTSGTQVQKDQVLDISVLADGLFFIYDTEDNVLRSGPLIFNTLAYSGRVSFTLTPAISLDLSISYSAKINLYQSFYVNVIRGTKTSTMIKHKVKSSRFIGENIIQTYTLEQGIQYTIEIIAEHVDDTYGDIQVIYNNVEYQHITITDIHLEQPVKTTELGYIDDNTVFDLERISDSLNFYYIEDLGIRSYSLPQQDGTYLSTSRGVSYGYSLTYITFTPTADGILTCETSISAQRNNYGYLILYKAHSDIPDTNGEYIYYGKVRPTQPQVQRGDTPSISNEADFAYFVRHTNIQSNVTSTINVQAGIDYILGIGYQRSSGNASGDDGFSLHSLQYRSNKSNQKYLIYVSKSTTDSKNKVGFAAVTDTLTGIKLFFPREEEALSSGLSTGTEKSLQLRTAHNKTNYGTTLDTRTIVQMPEITQQSFEYDDDNVLTPQYYIDDNRVFVIGDLSATVVGDYQLIFGLRDTNNTVWSDGTTSRKIVGMEWYIKKKQWEVSTDNSRNITIDAGHRYDIKYTYNKPFGKTLSGAVINENSNIATINFNGEINGISEGYTHCSIYMPGDSNHISSKKIKYNVTVTKPNYSAEEIKDMLYYGTIQDYLSVGDIIYVPLKEFTLYKDTYYSQEFGFIILGFNHNSEIEGNNSIHLRLAVKNRDERKIGYLSNEAFTKSGDTITGWIDSNIRQSVQNIYSKMPTSSSQYYYCKINGKARHNAWQNKYDNTIKYSNNNMNGQISEAHNFSRLMETMFIPSVYEIFGDYFSDNIECGYQKQYDYYKNYGPKPFNAIKGDIHVGTYITTGTRSIAHNVNPKGNYYIGDSSGKPGVSTLSITNYRKIAPCIALYAHGFLNNYSWKQIRWLLETDQFDNYVQQGDYKEIKISGTIYDSYFSNITLVAIYLAHGHNAVYEGKDKAHFVFGIRQANSIRYFLALTDSDLDQEYQPDNAWTGFAHSYTTSSGWYGSNIRKEVLPVIYAGLEPDLKEIIFPCPKYFATKYNGDSDTVEWTADNLWLMSEYEITGTNNYSNQYEANYQQKYSFPAKQPFTPAEVYNNVAMLPYKNQNLEAVNCWTRSVSDNGYCKINFNTVTAGTQNSIISQGLAICFTISGQYIVPVTPVSGEPYETTWQEVKNNIINGNISQYNIGDIFWFPMKEVQLAAGPLRGGTYGAKIIGINHNSEIEGNNRIHFQICRIQGYDVDIALYGTDWRGNMSSNNRLSYECSGMRNYWLNRIYAALPHTLQQVITPVLKYSEHADELANSNSSTEPGKFNYETIFLPSQYEVLGQQNNMVACVPLYQQQYAYFTDNESRRRYLYDGENYNYRDKVSFGSYFLRTEYMLNSNARTIYVNDEGTRTVNQRDPYTGIYGITPCFTIGKDDIISNSEVTLANNEIYAPKDIANHYGRLQIGDVIPINMKDIILQNSQGYHVIRAGVIGAKVVDIITQTTSGITQNIVTFMLCMHGNQRIALTGTSFDSHNNNSWLKSDMYKVNMTNIYNAFPDEWKEAIHAKQIRTYYNDSQYTYDNIYLWLPSVHEFTGQTIYANTTEQYEYVRAFAMNGTTHNISKGMYYAYDNEDELGSRVSLVWLRTPVPDEPNKVYAYNPDTDQIVATDITDIAGITPCFRVTYSIPRKDFGVTPPTISNTSLSYTGEEIGPTITHNDNADRYIIIGDKAKAVGIYNMTIRLIAQESYWNGTETREDIVTSWKITQASSNISYSHSGGITLNESNPSSTITITSASPGPFSYRLTKQGIVSVAINGKQINITAIQNGQTVLHIYNNNPNYSSSFATKTITVKLGTALDQMTWAEISDLSREGTLLNYVYSGYTVSMGSSKQVNVDGMLGSKYISDKLCAVLLGVDHNAEYENPDNTSVSHWALMMNNDGRFVALTDDWYGRTITNGQDRFCHNPYNNKINGGWSTSNIRRIINRDLPDIIDEELNVVITPIIKYSNNSQDMTVLTNDQDMTPTQDKFWLLSAVELGLTNAAINQQTLFERPYSYFSDNAQRTMYNADSPSAKCQYHTRSMLETINIKKPATQCITVDTSGKYSTVAPNISYGIMPCFAVGKQACIIDLTTAVPSQTYDFMYGSYTINNQSIIDPENGILNNVGYGITFNFSLVNEFDMIDPFRDIRRFDISFNVYFLDIPGILNIMNLCQIINGYGFSTSLDSLGQGGYLLEQTTNDGFITYENPTHYSFEAEQWYKISISVKGTKVTYKVDDDIVFQKDTCQKINLRVIDHFFGSHANSMIYIKDIFIYLDIEE